VTARTDGVATEAGTPTAAWAKASSAGARYLLLTMTVAGVIALVPLLRQRRFYFFDDTQSSAVGVWWETGRYLVQQGTVPFLLPDRYMAGNIPVEGQWATFNPLVLALGLITFYSGNLLLVATAVKVVSLVALAGGVYLTVRSYGVEMRWAMAAGVAAPFIGFTTYFDAASWVTGLWVFAGLSWTWWSLRRFRIVKGLPILPFLLGYSVVSIGYVHGTLMLAVLILGLIVEAWLERDRGAALRLLGLGAILGLVAVFIFLPSLLSSGVTWRTAQGVANDNILSPDPSVLAASFVADYQPWLIARWATGPIGAPLAYISWLPLLLIFVNWRQLNLGWRPYAAPVAIWLVSFVLIFGPSTMGPLRYPIRLLPYLGLATLILTMVVVSRLPLVFARGRLGILAAVAAVGFWFSFAELPSGVVGQLASVGLAGGAVVLLVWAQSRRQLLVPVVIVLATGLAMGLQVLSAPKSPLPDFGLPAKASAYRGIVPNGSGSLFVVGDPRHLKNPWTYTSFGNGWSMTGASAVNVYTPVGFAAMGNELCIETHGSSCPDSVNRLFAVDATTGKTVADLLAIDTVQLLKVNGVDVTRQPPVGWHREAADGDSVLWKRDTKAAKVGGVSWVQDGVKISEVVITDRQLSFKVDAAPAKGGKVVTSRLAWPGYSTTAGVIAAPLRGYLLTAEVSPADVGKTVTLSFSPPAWNLTVACGVAAGIAVLAWAVAALVIGRRRQSSVAV
jgi:hypothetical protein